MKRRLFPLLLLPALLAGFSGCRQSSPPVAVPPREKPEVWVTNYPLRYFTERLGGDAVTVVYKVPPDIDPAFWRPDDDEIAGFQAANLVVANGATYEKWAATVSLMGSRLVETAKGFSKDFIKVQDGKTHSHGKEGEHSHAGTAFTTWLDFRQALQQAEAVRDGLKKVAPGAAADIDSRFAALEADLKALDAEMEKAAQKAAHRPLVASHPVYHYWARRYHLNVKAVEWEPETVPDEAALADLKAILDGYPATLMVWEDNPDPASVEKLRALGIASTVFAPAANVPESGDFLSAMKANVARVAEAFGQP